MTIFDAPLNPTPDEAARALERELQHWRYALEQNWLDQLLQWIANLTRGNPTAPNLPTVSSMVIVIVALAVVAIMTRRLWPGRATTAQQRSHGETLLEAGVSARTYRERATDALARGDYDRSVIEGFRAIVADLDARHILGDRPARTAHEAAQLIASAIPSSAEQIRQAADWFDRAAYGVSADAQRTTPEQAHSVLDLGETLAHARGQQLEPAASGSPNYWGAP